MNPGDPVWSNHNRGGYMFVRYFDVTDEQLTAWGPELEEGLPGHPTFTTGIVEIVPEPSSILALTGLLTCLIGKAKVRQKGR